MDCVVQGVTKSRTRLSDFDLATLSGGEMFRPAASKPEEALFWLTLRILFSPLLLLNILS